MEKSISIEAIGKRIAELREVARGRYIRHERAKWWNGEPDMSELSPLELREYGELLKVFTEAVKNNRSKVKINI